MTLKQEIQKVFPNIPEDHFHNYCSDLQILYNEEIHQWLMDNFSHPSNIELHIADVKGSDWYGKKFIEVPFAYVEYHESKFSKIKRDQPDQQ